MLLADAGTPKFMIRGVAVTGLKGWRKAAGGISSGSASAHGPPLGGSPGTRETG
jgi:hypothetical protein